ncbi:hypothetical protein G9A89_011532 [Geosiphon pyriformis]|nr:hypothetical protein G9A89_011532 [Geosiphon pyriformis]
MTPLKSAKPLNQRKRRNPYEIDTTGRRYIFQVRGAEYAKSRRSRNQNSSCDSNCKSCEESNEFFNFMEAQLDEFEKKLNNAIQVAENSCHSNSEDKFFAEKLNIDFSKMSIDELLKVSKNVGDLVSSPRSKTDFQRKEKPRSQQETLEFDFNNQLEYSTLPDMILWV